MAVAVLEIVSVFLTLPPHDPVSLLANVDLCNPA
jgi:hypothetical protein